MTRQIALWAYPWDLHDLGIAPTSARLTALGVNMISLATSYHAGRFLQPGNPRRRLYFPEDGTVYYRPAPERWANHEITPKMAAIVDTEGDKLRDLIRARDNGGLAVSCWTVCLHNTRLGMAHPQHVMRTAQGDAHSYALCPSSGAARAYLTTMISEISHRYRPDRIELESPDFMSFSHGFHHEKDSLGLLGEDEFLLGVCFCDACMTRARTAGVPADLARTDVASLLDAAMTRALPRARFPDFPTLGIEAFADFPALLAYLRWRPTVVTSLLSRIKSATHPDTRLMLIDAVGSSAGGVDLPAVTPHLDGIVHCAYTTPPNEIAPLMVRTRALLGPDRILIAGFELSHPNVRDGADLATRVAAADPYVDGANFYSLGLVPAARLDWIGRSIQTPPIERLGVGFL